MLIKNILSTDACFLLNSTENSMLLDVRTPVEWKLGIPLLKSENIILISWLVQPDMQINKNFLLDLQTKIKDLNCELFFLCGSGIRSLAAAEFIFQSGYTKCYNIADGFLGSNYGVGWRNNNLPWKTQ